MVFTSFGVPLIIPALIIKKTTPVITVVIKKPIKENLYFLK